MKLVGAIFLSLLLLSVFLGNGPWINAAQARPGGGHSSSGHSSSSHSSSSHSSSWHSSSSGGSSWSHSSSSGSNYSDGDSDAVFWFVVIFFIIIIALIIIGNNQPKTITSRPNRVIKNIRNLALSQALAKLQQSDANFSKILLIDFTHLLFSKLYRYAGQLEFSYLSPFLSEELQRQYQFLAPQPAEEIVINGIQWESVTQNTEQDAIGLLIEANYSLNIQNQKSRYAVTERWLLCRKAGLISPEPKQMQALSCPNCAAPAHFNDAGVCPYCKNVLHKGEAQWYLSKRVIILTTQLESSGLVSYAQEQGNNLVTIKQPDLNQQISNMQQLHQLTNWDSFFNHFKDQIIRPYFLSIYQHWSVCDWDGVRHLLSDRLFEANQFWTDLYKQHNWFNRLDNLSIQRIVLAKIEIDRYYEAMTVRIYAACNDYTEDSQGKIIGGSKSELRRYSEYWTFVRRIDTPQNATKFKLNQCPQCGAPADQMGQAAECGYCGSKISTGEFSWVLFLITQDEVYVG